MTVVKAAGRTLTVGELREALTGLRDDDPVLVASGEHVLEVGAVESTPTGVEVEVHGATRTVYGVCEACGDDLDDDE